MGLLIVPRRIAVLGVTLATAGGAGCSFLLDFDSLGGGPPPSASVPLDAGSGGSSNVIDAATGGGGSGGNAGTVDDAATSDTTPEATADKDCTSDLDCIDTATDACVHVSCGADHKCSPPELWKGPAVEAVADAEKVLEADEIGIPQLIADDRDIVLAAYSKVGATTNVEFRRYPDNPSLGASKGDLLALAPGRFTAFAASPALYIESLPRRLRVLVPASVAEAGAVGMQLLWLDIGPGALKLTPQQPSPPDLGVTGYDTSPLISAPQFFDSQLKVKAMWVQHQKLFLHDGTTAAEAFAAKKVTDFALLTGLGVHAAIETTDATGAHATELWSEGASGLSQLVDDELGHPRLGVSATSTDESGQKINVVSWSYQTPAGPVGRATGATCKMVDACTSARLPGGETSASFFPRVASARAPGSATERILASTSIFGFVDPAHPDMALSALIGTLAWIKTPASGDPEFAPFNPSAIVIAAAVGPASAPPGATLGEPALVVTPTGQIMSAWVEHPAPGKSVLATRRYRVKMCN
jgi:hypothetical protein